MLDLWILFLFGFQICNGLICMLSRFGFDVFFRTCFEMTTCEWLCCACFDVCVFDVASCEPRILNVVFFASARGAVNVGFTTLWFMRAFDVIF